MTQFFKAAALALSLAFVAAPALAVTGPSTSTPAPAPLSSKATELLAAATETCRAPGATKEACSAAVAAYVAQLKSEGLTGEALDVALVPLVSALSNEASKLDPAVRQIVADVITVVAGEFTDKTRADAAASIATDVAVGKDPPQTGAIETPASGA